MFNPGEVWRDTDGNPIQAHGGGILHCNGVFYWYGENKDGITYESGHNVMRVDAIGVSCYSSHDLYSWKNEGVVLTAVSDPNHDLHTSKVIERPKVIYNKKTNKYVMWLHIDSSDYKYARAGVAVSDSPTGPFNYLGSMRPNGYMSRDMTLFVDDDQSAYLIYSTKENATTHLLRLSEDYLRPSHQFVELFPDRYMEAHAIFKWNGRYYYLASGCTGWDPNPARGAVADSIWGPWTELDNPCMGPDSEITFQAQSTFMFAVDKQKGEFIAMFDRWHKENLTDSRYVWLPITLNENGYTIQWHDQWDLSIFEDKLQKSYGANTKEKEVQTIF